MFYIFILLINIPLFYLEKLISAFLVRQKEWGKTFSAFVCLENLSRLYV